MYNDIFVIRNSKYSKLKASDTFWFVLLLKTMLKNVSCDVDCLFKIPKQLEKNCRFRQNPKVNQQQQLCSDGKDVKT